MKPPQAPKTPSSARKARLAEELRANLLKRKQQARGRRDGAAEELPASGDAAAGSEAEAETAEGKPRD